MKHIKTIGLVALGITTSALSYLVYDFSSKSETLSIENAKLNEKNKEISKSLSELSNKESKTPVIAFNLIQGIKSIDSYIEFQSNIQWLNQSLFKPVNDELYKQRKSFLDSLEKLQTANSNVDISGIEEKVKSVMLFTSRATEKFNLLSSKDYAELQDTQADFDSNLKPSSEGNQVKAMYRNIVYLVSLTAPLESLKESVGSQKLNFCQGLTEESKTFIKEYENVENEMQSLNNTIQAKPWLNPVAKLTMLDLNTFNFNSFRKAIGTTVIAKAIDTDYSIDMSCDYFKARLGSLNTIKDKIAESKSAIDLIEPKVSSSLSKYCKISSIEDCKEGVDVISTSVATKIATYPFGSDNMDKLIDELTTKFIRNKESSANQQDLKNNKVLQNSRNNNQQQRDSTIPLGQNAQVIIK